MELRELLHTVPDPIRSAVLEEFNKLLRNFRTGRWEPAELDGGRFCEAAYLLLRGYVDGEYATRLSKPKDFRNACNSLEQADNKIPHSVRVHIPRILIAIYGIRNSRGVGHIGGDVNPNHMDSSAILMMVKWVVCEFIRIFHEISIDDATRVVDSIVERETPLIWKVDGKARVLLPSLSKRDQTLLILVFAPSPLTEEYLRESVEHSNGTVYRRDILKPLHRQRLVEYNADTRRVSLSPLGLAYVEKNIIPQSERLKEGGHGTAA